MPLNYVVKEFKLEDLTGDNSRITIPQFQRGLVWSKETQRNFIGTMLKGDPFGSILLALDSENDYYLIDGLQRVSTIKRFMKQPDEYIDEEFIDLCLFQKLLDLFNYSNLIPEVSGKNKYIDEIKKNLLEFYKKSKSISRMYIDFKLKYQIKSEKHDDLTLVIEEIFNDIKEKTKLNSAVIPAIIYTGDKANLPDVFERMNTGAVTLSKYEVLASTWYKLVIDIDDKEITSHVKNKYLMLKEKSNLDVNFDLEELDGKINVFEYCYAIGEIIKDKKNGVVSIFGEKKNALSTDSLGFDIIAILLSSRINNVEPIKDFIYKAPDRFLTDLKDCIKVVAQDIEKILLPWISYGDSGKKNTYNVISGYQALHIFVAFFYASYDFDATNYALNKKTELKLYKKMKKYLPLHVLVDIVSDYWGKNRQVNDLSKNIIDEELLYKYKNNLSREDIYSAINEYILKSNESKKKTISIESKFILNFQHKIQIRNQEYSDKFLDKDIDYEHITPKDRVKDIIEDISISSISNLCVMLPRDNRSKKSMTLYEDESSRATYQLSESILEMMIYPNKEELNFLNLNKEQKKSGYIEFIKNRRNTLVNRISNSVYDFFNNII